MYKVFLFIGNISSNSCNNTIDPEWFVVSTSWRTILTPFSSLTSKISKDLCVKHIRPTKNQLSRHLMSPLSGPESCT